MFIWSYGWEKENVLVIWGLLHHSLFWKEAFFPGYPWVKNYTWEGRNWTNIRTERPGMITINEVSFRTSDLCIGRTKERITASLSCSSCCGDTFGILIFKVKWNSGRTNLWVLGLILLDAAVSAMYPTQVSCALVGPAGIKVLLRKFYPISLAFCAFCEFLVTYMFYLLTLIAVFTIHFIVYESI